MQPSTITEDQAANKNIADIMTHYEAELIIEMIKVF
jgi:hypothetical protein